MIKVARLIVPLESPFMVRPLLFQEVVVRRDFCILHAELCVDLVLENHDPSFAWDLGNCGIGRSWKLYLLSHQGVQSSH